MAAPMYTGWTSADENGIERAPSAGTRILRGLSSRWRSARRGVHGRWMAGVGSGLESVSGGVPGADAASLRAWRRAGEQEVVDTETIADTSVASTGNARR